MPSEKKHGYRDNRKYHKYPGTVAVNIPQLYDLDHRNHGDHKVNDLKNSKIFHEVWLNSNVIKNGEVK